MNKSLPVKFSSAHILIFILSSFVLACAPHEETKDEKLFQVDFKILPGDTTIESATFFQGFILLLKTGGELLVLDTALNYVDSLTGKLAGKHYGFMNSYHDTLFLENRKDRKQYYVDSTFTINRYRKNIYDNFKGAYYEDSLYHVSGCSAGEFGASVFFRNKQTKQTFSYPVTTVQQVLKFNGSYVITNYLAHLGGISDYLWVDDPTQLYELKEERLKNHCNWWIEVDSVRNRSFNKRLPKGVRFYTDTFTTHTLVTFQHDSRLFSIYSTDSATLLGELIDFKLVPVDTLLHHPLNFYQASTNIEKETILTAHQATWSTFDGSRDRSYQETGLVYVRGTRVSFLSFKIP